MTEKEVFILIIGYVAISVCLWLGGSELMDLSRRVAELEQQIANDKLKTGTLSNARPCASGFSFQ